MTAIEAPEEVPGDARAARSARIEDAREIRRQEIRIVQSVQAQVNLPALMLGLVVSAGIVGLLDWSATVSSHAVYPLGLLFAVMVFPVRSWLRLRGKPRPRQVSKRRIRTLETFSGLLGLVWSAVIYLIMGELSPADNAFVMAVTFCLCFASVGLNPSLPRAAAIFCALLLFSLMLSALENEVLRPDILLIGVAAAAMVLGRMVWQNWQYTIHTVDLGLKQTATGAALERVSAQLAKYISPHLYKGIFSGEHRVAIESKRKKLTIFFSDIANFTEITDQLESEELTALLNQYLTEMSIIASRHGANFDKFIGDAMVFYFGDFESEGVSEDAARCVRMAIAMQRRLAELETTWREQGLIDQPFKTRIGINTGYCTVGNFGSEQRMDYTIIGGEVNLAARLQSHAKPGGILMSAETYAQVRSWLPAEERAAIHVKGFQKPIRTFEAQIDAVEAADERMIRHETEGMTVSIDLGRVDRSETIAALTDVLRKLQS